jgi:mRNA interferase MazF
MRSGRSRTRRWCERKLLPVRMLRTVVVCALTSNLRRATASGNVLLEPGEAYLPRQRVVYIAPIFTVDTSQ